MPFRDLKGYFHTKKQLLRIKNTIFLNLSSCLITLFFGQPPTYHTIERQVYKQRIEGQALTFVR